MYFTSTLIGYDREDCLLDLLLLYAEPVNCLIMEKRSKKDKLHAESSGIEVMLKRFRERRAAILKDAKVI
jgi:hypothetical protein